MGPTDEIPRFYCDAMLGGLARWLRAAGYDAAYEYGIDDGVLIARAQKQRRIILSSDGPLFERTVVREGGVAALFVPRQLGKFQQLAHVMRQLSLPRRAPRCMGCGGELIEVPKHAVTAEAPPLAFRHCSRFWRCRRCEKLLWHGTHWQKVDARLRGLAGEL
jgi:uncharacterized protein with PIN domain